MMIKRIIVCLTVSMLIISGGCKSKMRQEPVKQKEKTIPIIKWKTIETKDMKETLGFVGDITGEDEAVVYSKVPGKLLEKKVHEGDTVKKGDTIVTINRDEVGYTFEPAPVISPLDGVVGRIYLDRGDNVTSSTPIALVVRMDSVRVRINVVERYIPFITKGQVADVTVEAYPGEVFHGAVYIISPVVEPSTRTSVMEINIPNADHKLMPGMFAKVSIIIGERKGVPVISKDYLLTEGSNKFVFVVIDEKVHKRFVTLGIREDNLFEVKEGLTSGEKVVVQGQYGVEDETLVKAEEMQ